jgi:hypothetical protein
MNPEDDFVDTDFIDLDEAAESFDTMEDLLDAALDSPTDFDEYIMNEDDCRE